MVHDIDYDKAETRQDEHVAGKKILKTLNKVEPKNFRETVDRAGTRSVTGTNTGWVWEFKKQKLKG